MEYLYAFLGGMLNKIYDDLFDNKIITDDFAKEMLKGAQWILLTLLSYNDFNFALCFYSVNVLNAIYNIKEWSFPYEKSLLAIFPFLLLISFNTAYYITTLDMAYIFIFATTNIIEPLVITEEFSNLKFVSRIFATLCSFGAIVGGLYFGISTTFNKISFYCFGYCLVSACFQAYLLTRSPVT